MVFVGDYDLADLGAKITSLPDWAAGPLVNRARYATVGRAGGHSDEIDSIGPREFSIGLVLESSTVAARKALLDTLLDAVKGTQDWRFSDDPDRFVRAELVDFDVGAEYPSASFADPAADLSVLLSLYADYPHKVDVAGTVVAFASGGSPFVGGTEDSAGIIEITDATNPVLTVDDFRGDEQASMTFGALTVDADEVFRIDLTLGTLTLYDNTGAGTVGNSNASLTAGTFFRLNRHWWDRLADVGCVLKTTSGNGRLLTRKAWQT